MEINKDKLLKLFENQGKINESVYLELKLLENMINVQNEIMKSMLNLLNINQKDGKRKTKTNNK